MSMRERSLTRAAITQDPEMKMNMTKGLGMNTTTWRGSIYVWPNKPSAMSS